MNTNPPAIHVAVSRPRIAWLMVLCGIAGAASIGAVSAATAVGDVPSITLKYDPKRLATDSGAREVYRQLVRAAAEVCPDQPTGTLILSKAIQECRKQAIARAVYKINDPRLAQIYTDGSKSG